MMNVPRGKMIPASWRLNQMPAIVIIAVTLMLVKTAMLLMIILATMISVMTRNEDIGHMHNAADGLKRRQAALLCQLDKPAIDYY